MVWLGLRDSACARDLRVIDDDWSERQDHNVVAGHLGKKFIKNERPRRMAAECVYQGCQAAEQEKIKEQLEARAACGARHADGNKAKQARLVDGDAHICQAHEQNDNAVTCGERKILKVSFLSFDPLFFSLIFFFIFSPLFISSSFLYFSSLFFFF